MNNTERVNYLFNSKLFKLATIQLKREGKLEKISIGKMELFECDPLEVILKGYEILKKAHRAKLRL